MRRSLLPKLQRNHPQFFFIFFATAMFHLAVGIQMTIHPDAFNNPSFVEVARVAPIQAWGAAHIATWALFTLGSYWNFSVARVGLALGLVLVLARGALIELAPNPAGSSLFIFLLIAALHYAQAAEPPINPLTRRE